MIKCEKGNVKLSGMTIELLVELSSIVNAIHKGGKIRKKDIKKAVEVGLMSEKEKKEKTEEINRRMAEIDDVPFFREIKEAFDELMKEAANVRHESTDKSDN